MDKELYNLPNGNQYVGQWEKSKKKWTGNFHLCQWIYVSR